MSWKTIKYDGQLDFSKFTCDEPVLNDYLHHKAVQDHENDLCTLYFLINEKNELGGFYVLSNGSILRQELPTAKARKNLPGYPLGTIHIGRLARHKDVINQKLGERLIFSALDVAVQSSKNTAAHAITVDAKNQRAEEYYSLQLNPSDCGILGRGFVAAVTDRNLKVFKWKGLMVSLKALSREGVILN